jgi:small-conductance mechanosensitive channel
MFLENTMVLKNTLGQWLTAVAIAVATGTAMVLMKRVIHRRVLAIARKTATRLDDMAARLILETKPLAIAIAAVYFGSLSLTLPPKVSWTVERLAISALLVQGGLWAIEILLFWLDPKRGRGAADDAAVTTTMGVLSFAVRLGIWATVGLLVLDNFGFHITTLLAGLGVGGVAIALATQNILGDLFASLSIILDKPFVVGDFIVVDDLLGKVEKIGLKTTRIRSLSGEQLVFGNGELLKSRIRNYARMEQRRIAFSIGVTYQTPGKQIEAIPSMIREIIEGQPKTRFERAHFKSYGPSSLDFEVVYWVLTPDYLSYMDIQQAINVAIYRRFEDENIQFAYPTRTVILAGGNA